jgi:plasmid stabilization system protein ParE
MRVEYSKQATANLRKAAADSRPFGEAITAALEARIREVVAHVAAHPESAERVAGRPGCVSCRSSAILIDFSTGRSQTACEYCTSATRRDGSGRRTVEHREWAPTTGQGSTEPFSSVAHSWFATTYY